MREQKTFSRHAVKVRRPDYVIAISSGVRPGPVVGEAKQKVGPACVNSWIDREGGKYIVPLRGEKCLKRARRTAYIQKESHTFAPDSRS